MAAQQHRERSQVAHHPRASGVVGLHLGPGRQTAEPLLHRHGGPAAGGVVDDEVRVPFPNLLVRVVPDLGRPGRPGRVLRVTSMEVHHRGARLVGAVHRVGTGANPVVAHRVGHFAVDLAGREVPEAPGVPIGVGGSVGGVPGVDLFGGATPGSLGLLHSRQLANVAHR